MRDIPRAVPLPLDSSGRGGFVGSLPATTGARSSFRAPVRV